MRKYNFKFLKGDLMAGISVAAISLPIGVAYAEIVHLPPESGIYTTIFALLCYFLLGSSKEAKIGPDSVSATLMAATIFAISSGNSELNLQLAVLITITTGLFMFIAGFLKFGFISNFLSKPILIGYMNGIALILIISQLEKFTGIKTDGSNSLMNVWDLFHKIGMIHLPTLMLGTASVIFIIIVKKISSKIPAQLILLVLSVLLERIFNLSGQGIKLTQEIGNAFPVFTVPDINIFTEHIKDILIAATAVLFISYTGEISSARSFTKDKNSLKPNREFFTLGLADIISGFFKGFPSSGSSSLAVVSISSGGKTKAVNLFASIIIFLVIIFLSKQFALIHSVIFGAIIFDAASGLLKFKDLLDIKKFSRKEFNVALICMTGVLLIGVYQGIMLAIILSLIQLIIRSSKPLEQEMVYDAENKSVFEINEDNQNLLRNDIMFYRYNSSLLFFNCEYFTERISRRASDKENLKVIIIDAGPINYIDLTGINNLVDVIKDFNNKGIRVLFTGIKDRYLNILTDKLKSCDLNTDIFYSDVSSYFGNN